MFLNVLLIFHLLRRFIMTIYTFHCGIIYLFISIVKYLISVLFRVMGLNVDLKPYTGTFKITITVCVLYIVRIYNLPMV